VTKQEAINEIEDYLQDADKAISEDKEYIRGWKSALLTALEIVVNINKLNKSQCDSYQEFDCINCSSKEE